MCVSTECECVSVLEVSTGIVLSPHASWNNTIRTVWMCVSTECECVSVQSVNVCQFRVCMCVRTECEYVSVQSVSVCLCSKRSKWNNDNTLNQLKHYNRNSVHVSIVRECVSLQRKLPLEHWCQLENGTVSVNVSLLWDSSCNTGEASYKLKKSMWKCVSEQVSQQSQRFTVWDLISYIIVTSTNQYNLN